MPEADSEAASDRGFVPHSQRNAPAWASAADARGTSDPTRSRDALKAEQKRYLKAAAIAAGGARPPAAPSLSAGGPELIDEREFDTLPACTGEEARNVLDQLMDLDANKKNSNLVPRAYVTLLKEGAKPWDLLDAWRAVRAQAGNRPGEYQPQLAKWLMKPLADRNSARAAMAKRRDASVRFAERERNKMAAELYRVDDAFHEAFDAFKYGADREGAMLSDAERESARQVCHDLLEDYIRRTAAPI